MPINTFLDEPPPADLPLPKQTHFPGWTNIPYYTADQMLAHREAYAKAAVAAERERCAKICDLHSRLTWNDDRKAQSRVLAAEIRRGEIQAHQKGTV